MRRLPEETEGPHDNDTPTKKLRNSEEDKSREKDKSREEDKNGLRADEKPAGDVGRLIKVGNPEDGKIA